MSSSRRTRCFHALALVCLCSGAACAKEHQFDVIPYDAGSGTGGSSSAGQGGTSAAGGATGSGGSSQSGGTGGQTSGGGQAGAGTGTGGVSTGGTGGTSGSGGSATGGTGTGGAATGGAATGGTGGATACTGVGEHRNPATNVCYRVVDADTGGVSATYAAAEISCETWGGTLLAIDSQTEQDYIDLILSNRDCWIGLSATSPTGPYTWETGATTAAFSNWLSGEPSNTTGELCGQLYGNFHHPNSEVGFWNNASCTTTPTCYYCER